MVNNRQIIAKRDIVAVEKTSGVRKNITAEVFLPQFEEDGKNCFCLICLDGIDGESYSIGGADSLQALSLAVSRMRSRFKELREEYDFFWPEDNAPMESIDYADIILKYGSSD